MEDKELLPDAWRDWVSLLQALLAEVLLPLLLLHCRRGSARVPLASLAASLDAAGGQPIAGCVAAAAAALLTTVCPGQVELVAGKPPSITVKLSARAQREVGQEEKREERQAATCAGVVAKGFSLALPPEGGVSAQGAKDPAAKRWERAQREFYVDTQAIEAELDERKRECFGLIEAYARQHAGEVPPSLEGAGVAATNNTPPQAHSEDQPPQPHDEGPPPQARAEGPQQGPATADLQRSEGAEGSVLSFVPRLEAHPEYRQQVCHVERYEACAAEYVNFEDLVDFGGRPLLSPAALDALRHHLSIERLFRHQHAALRAVLGERKHLCLTTGTSSGKSLAFALPILEAYRREPRTRALIIFPTKALAQDQLSKLQRLFGSVCPELNVCTFDGDTPQAQRAGLLKTCSVFLTNPDMLHFTILANHSRWRQVLENLAYVVLDEAHVYRAAFGTHTAFLMRRFRRVLRHYRAEPLFIACSATICNASAFFSQLLDLEEHEACIVDRDTAGRGRRHFCLWNPPLLEDSSKEQNARKRGRFPQREGNGAGPKLPPGVGYRTRSSPYEEAAWLLAQAVERGHRTVCFLQVRAMVELVLQAAHGRLESRPQLQARVAGYRGGYAAAERRRLEQRLFSGELLGVVATNALELGIDIGDLDATIHVGVPPTVASVWQQAGRAGRRGRASVAVLVAMDAPLEQHFCRHPQEFFARALEPRLPDLGNALLLRGHVLCAATELPPLTEAEEVFGAAAAEAVTTCQREGRLVSQAGGLRHCRGKAGKAPKEELSLRDIDPVQFRVLVRGSSTPLETLDQKLAFMRLHPGAVYLNQRLAYFVEDLDITAKVAWVTPRDPKRIDYFTEPREHTQVVLSGGGLSRPAALPVAGPTSVVRCGAVTVYWRMYGFRKVAKEDRRIMDTVSLSLPPVEYPTQAVWMDLPGSVLQPVDQAGHSVDRGGLHSLEHAMMALAPLCCDLECAELSCQHTRRDDDPNRYLLLLYEGQKGGAGTAAKVYAQWEELLGRAVKLLEECPCEEGCPKCIVIPHCGEYNHGLDKAAALLLGRALGFGAAPPPPVAPAKPAAFAKRLKLAHGGMNSAPCACVDLD